MFLDRGFTGDLLRSVSSFYFPYDNFVCRFDFIFMKYTWAYNFKSSCCLFSKGTMFCKNVVFKNAESCALQKNWLKRSKMSQQDGRFAGCFWRQLLTKSLNSGLHVSKWLKLGAGWFVTFIKTSIAWRLWWGGLPYANSRAVIPSDQMSAFRSYPSGLCSMTSGAIQHGEPTKVCFLPCMLFTLVLMPKSLSTTSPSRPTSIFPPLISRWIWHLLWK